MLLNKQMICYSRRCKKGMPTNIESLPTDLLFEILLRLPADHLYERARLVYLFEIGVLATCNGLALEIDFKDYLLRLVNPATKQSFLLPRGVSYALHLLKCGFAYSAASLAYKVIAPYTVRHSPPRLQTDYGLDVFTVGVDESWRHVEVHHLPDHVRPFFFDKAPLTSEGFLHWGRGRYCVTLDMETEIITLSEAPYQYHESKYKYLSTGRCVSLLVACGDLSWEVWEMKAETGQWRMALPNIDLGAQRRIRQLGHKDDRVLEPLGWVKYPQVLAFYFGAFYFGRQCNFYNLDTHQLDFIELPQCDSDYDAFPHKNSLIWPS